MPKTRKYDFVERADRRRASIMAHMTYNHWKQTDVAKIWGVSPPTVCHKLKDPGRITIEELRLLGMNSEQIRQVVIGS